ncbi:hypothetical protein CEXT_194661 [Caerostris extrusa]|uniref:Uncharacterized protein n=1 Tax=Caerostris extrusa TaxID=172846 RepID=A0AAV4XF36_CAEEX|nr:hypothetical protein CEXT_194661 [Caerostris extrusa]
MELPTRSSGDPFSNSLSPLNVRRFSHPLPQSKVTEKKNIPNIPSLTLSQFASVPLVTTAATHKKKEYLVLSILFAAPSSSDFRLISQNNDSADFVRAQTREDVPRHLLITLLIIENC